MKRKFFALLAVLTTLSILVSACAGIPRRNQRLQPEETTAPQRLETAAPAGSRR
jgi:Na+-transporting methylmalonyl-CoA/oxaloacetate decarboxylase gamma subunit